MESLDGLDLVKDFLKLGDANLNDARQMQLLEYLQKCLANPAWVHGRIAFLEALAENDPYPQGIVFPLSKEQLESVVKFGLIVAHKLFGVTLESLGRFAHSVQGLRDLTDVLTSIPESQWSVHWEGALDYPGEVPVIDSSEVLKYANADQEQDK